tara:strand:- start:4321 stop:5379 length:1059 start_codon:yes stop_codon:yes gene_type:complete
MQTPTAYILLILLATLIIYFSESKDYENLKIFIAGCFSSLLLFILFLYFTQTPIENFIYQYILFPLTIGEGRISSREIAYISLIDQINFKRLFGEFKFIHIFLIPLIFFSFKNFKTNKKNFNVLNFTIIATTLAFFFNQLITANQIYIFSLIPVLAAVLHLNLKNFNLNSGIIYITILLVMFATIKFHLRFNVDRKFHDIENVDKNNAIKANIINENFKNLKWISKMDDPKNELTVIKQALNIINNDKRQKTLITHYQFFSTFLNKPMNILNRWYLWDNNTHPTESHKYFQVYKSLINKNIKKNEIKVIYLLGQENEIKFNNIKNYFTDTCFESKTIVQNRFSSHTLVKCLK